METKLVHTVDERSFSLRPDLFEGDFFLFYHHVHFELFVQKPQNHLFPFFFIDVHAGILTSSRVES